MQRKHLLYIFVIIAAVILAACATATTPTAVVTEAPPVTQPTATTAVVPTTVPPTETPPPAAKTVVTILWTQEFDSLNPLYTNMWFVTTTDQLWNNWAWEYNEQNEAHPVLVTELPSADNGGISADGKTITFHIKPGIVWSDGTPLTSTDFKFTYEMATSTSNAVNTAYPYDKIASIDTPDDATVVVNFTDPFAPWLATLWKGLLPSHILQPVYDKDGTLDNAEWNLAPTVGLGPYVFDAWESGSFARFVKNPNYWGTPAQIDEIFFRFVPDDAAQTTALLAGDGDMGAFIPPSDTPKLKEAGISIIVEPSGYNEGMFFVISADKGHPALLDVKVRQALAMAIDRDAFNRDVMLGLTKTPASFWDSLPFWNNPPLTNYAYDPEGAKALLDEAGWVDTDNDGVREKDGVELELTYGTTIRDVRQQAQAVFQEEWAQVGIKVTISSYESDLYFSNYGEGPAASGDIDIMEWSDAPMFPDPDIYYWLCSEIPSDEYPAGGNWFFLCDEELDALIQLQATQVNLDERQKTIEQINQIFKDKVYWLGVWQDPDIWAVGSRLQNVKFSGVTPFSNVLDWTIAP